MFLDENKSLNKQGPKVFEKTMRCQYCYQTSSEDHLCNATVS